MNRRQLLAWVPALGLCPLAEAAAPIGPDDIVLGQSADFSASRASVSRLYAEGTALYLDEVNAAGGIGGRRVRVLQLDDGYEVARAEQNVRALAGEHKAFALVHLVGTAITGKVLPFAAESGIPLVHPLTGADELRPPARVVREAFFLRASYGREIERIVGQLRTLGIANIGLVHEDETFGHGIRDAVHAAMKAQGLAAPATAVLPPNQTSEGGVAAAVEALRKVAPSAVIVGSAGTVVERFVQAYHQAGGRTQWYCLSVANVDRLANALGPLATGIVVAQVMPDARSSNLPVARDYRDAVARRGGTATGFGLEGYISARIIVQALREAGAPLARPRFIAALERQEKVGGFPIRYQDPRQGSPYVQLAMIGGAGKLVH